MSIKLTVSEKLILAAVDLEENQGPPFSAEDLVVRAWQMFPATFGLAGYNDEDGSPQYPDSNRVFSEIMGSKPIRKRGLIQKVGRKQYRLTESGREFAGLIGKRTEKGTEKATLSRETKREVKHLLGTRAFEKFRDGREESITFYDACAFWGISPRSSATNFSARREHVRAMIDLAFESLKGADEKALDHGGQALTDSDLRQLAELQDFMLTQFEAELSIIQGRKDRA